LAGCALAGAAAVALAGGGPQIKYTGADQSAARAAVIHRSDLPGAGWYGYFQRPATAELYPNVCGKFQPDDSDLVVTGADTSTWANPNDPLSTITSKAIVLKTPHMTRLDWRRTQQPSPAAACDAYVLTQGLAAAKIPGKLISYRRVAFPHVAGRTVAYRYIYAYSRGKPTIRLVVYVVYADSGRTKIWLAALSAESFLNSGYVARLARILVGRAQT
jgi:hypothetical protein